MLSADPRDEPFGQSEPSSAAWPISDLALQRVHGVNTGGPAGQRTSPGFAASGARAASARAVVDRWRTTCCRPQSPQGKGADRLSRFCAATPEGHVLDGVSWAILSPAGCRSISRSTSDSSTISAVRFFSPHLGGDRPKITTRDNDGEHHRLQHADRRPGGPGRESCMTSRLVTAATRVIIPQRTTELTLPTPTPHGPTEAERRTATGRR